MLPACCIASEICRADSSRQEGCQRWNAVVVEGDFRKFGLQQPVNVVYA